MYRVRLFRGGGDIGIMIFKGFCVSRGRFVKKKECMEFFPEKGGWTDEWSGGGDFTESSKSQI